MSRRKDEVYYVTLRVVRPKVADVAPPDEWNWDGMMNQGPDGEPFGEDKHTPIELISVLKYPPTRKELS